ncbi:molybdenum ABC transporter substrate-binding protein [Helicobacter sp. 13S00482-2]|uniref:substrate-binding domain-containing protein n=1 Tax=Helicobacter sp. 13S00482-2 TaxID=1476200 RepID=UPI000BA601AE|nr:substrate-binding domain-containing protein [Helicobacter sp. 13S00482-2]PAF53544.1 molybdenum ABC transporter substrate-binding protein [Helicobacter sp. 13S00482-2]
MKKSLLFFGLIFFCLYDPKLQAKELIVMISGGFHAAYQKLIPDFETKNKIKIKTISGPSMGNTTEAIPNRLKNNQKADVVIMVGSALEKLQNEGWILKGSKTELADSPIGAVIKKGNPPISIKTTNELKAALLNASSIAYSDSASGKYVSEELFKKLGIQKQMKNKAHMIPRIPVASVIAKGVHEIGFQQVSELLPISGVTFIGELPENLQHFTRFAGAVLKNSSNIDEAKDLLRYLSSPKAQKIIHSTGLHSINIKTPEKTSK